MKRDQGEIAMEKQFKKDECFVFIESGLNALEKIGWYGETKFICPVCGYDNANAKRIKTPNKVRNKSTWLYCEECGMLAHG